MGIVENAICSKTVYDCTIGTRKVRFPGRLSRPADTASQRGIKEWPIGLRLVGGFVAARAVEKKTTLAQRALVEVWAAGHRFFEGPNWVLADGLILRSGL